MTLSFDLSSASFLGHFKIIPYTKFEHFGIIRFLSYAADRQTNRQTNKQTDPNVIPTPTDSVGAGYNAGYDDVVAKHKTTAVHIGSTAAVIGLNYYSYIIKLLFWFNSSATRSKFEPVEFLCVWCGLNIARRSVSKA